MKKNKNKIIYKKLISPLIGLPILLTILGLSFIFEASSVFSFTNYGDSFYFLRLQILWFFISLLGLLFFYFFDYKKLYYLAFYIMLGVIFLLIIVLIPQIGHEVKGARRWLNLGFFNLQPTELAKLAVIIYLSSWFSYKERSRFFSFLILLSILIFLIILQPDMGTALIIFLLSTSLYFIANNSIIPLISFLPVAFGLFYLFIKISPYRFARLMAYFNPQTDPLGISYHINQIIISLKNGGLFGLGFGGSRQKYLYLPEAHTDSIFAIVAEDFGFMGSLVIIFLYLYFLFYIYKLIIIINDRLAKLLLAGGFFFFNYQILINLGGILNLIPLTGVSLPFLSYGGSNLLISYCLIGIFLNIEKKIKKI